MFEYYLLLDTRQVLRGKNTLMSSKNEEQRDDDDGKNADED